MEAEMDNKLICQICRKEFSSTSTRNRHVRDFHPEVEQPTRMKRIMCPMCPNEQVFSFHTNLLKHLTNNHQIKINESVLYFRNFEDFTAWKAMENREVGYACDVKRKNPNGEEDILYNCNRSDSRGFVSSSKKRNMKTGGSIRMRGMCPSRIKVKISKDGNVMVNFTETHVGHDDQLRSKRLSKDEQNLIVGQLTASEKRSECVLGSPCVEESEDLYINEPSTSQLYHQNDIKQFIQENSSTQDQETSLSLDKMREIGIAEISNFSKTLDKGEFENLMAVFTKFKNDITEKREQGRICKKRKIEKQTYYPNKK